MRTPMNHCARIAVTAFLLASTCAFAQTRRRADGNIAGAEWMAPNAAVRSVVLQLERLSDRGQNFMDARMIAAVAKSTAITDAALTKCFDKPIDELRPLVNIEAEPANESYITLTVAVSNADKTLGENPSGVVLAELCKQISVAVEKSAETQIEPLRARRLRLLEQIGEARTKFDAINAEYNRLAPLLENAGYPRISARSELEKQKSQLTGTIASNRAHIAQGEKTNVELDARSSSRPAPLLTRIVEIRQAQYDRFVAKVAAGQASQEEVELAELALLEVKIKLSEQTGSNYISGRVELANLRATLAGQEAQLAVIDAQLKELPAPTTAPSATPQLSMNQLNDINSDRQMARSRLQNLENELNQFDQQYGNLRAPKVVPLTTTQPE